MRDWIDGKPVESIAGVFPEIKDNNFAVRRGPLCKPAKRAILVSAFNRALV